MNDILDIREQNLFQDFDLGK
jgi:hypothetical protein